jgi:hypothetical protein
MKAILKIVIALAVLVACVNGGRAALTNYQFEDSVHQALLFNPRATDADIVEMVMKAGGEYEVPIEPAGITIRRSGPEVRVEMSYTRNIVLVPGVFASDWTFPSSASTRFLPGAGR